MAMKKAGAPPPDKEAVTALRGYTDWEYSRMNNALRRGEIDDDTAYLIAQAERGLEQLPAFEGPVFRGAKLPTSIIDQYKPGDTVIEKAFTSTSTKLSAAVGFGSGGGSPGVVEVTYRITSKTGRDISRISEYGDSEAEVLFKPHTRFMVKDVRTTGESQVVISMDEL